MAGLSQKQFQASLARFISEIAGQPARRPVRVTALLFSGSLIDSLKILDLIAFVESSLGIHIPDHEVTIHNFRTIRAISNAFWKRRRYEQT